MFVHVGYSAEAIDELTAALRQRRDRDDDGRSTVRGSIRSPRRRAPDDGVVRRRRRLAHRRALCHDRDAPVQHADAQRGGLRARPGQDGPHVHLRADRLRARPHRQLPHLRLRRRAAPDAEVPARLPRAAGDELHRRRRSHDCRRAEGRHGPARLHGPVHRGVPRGRAGARPRAGGREAARDRRAEPARDGRDDRARSTRTATPTAATGRSTSRSRRCPVTASWRVSTTRA